MKAFLVLFCVFGVCLSEVAVATGKDVRSVRSSVARPKRPGKDVVSIARDGEGVVFVFRGQKFRSSEELLKSLDLRRYYDVTIDFLGGDERVFSLVQGLLQDGLKVNFVKRAVNNGPGSRFVTVESFLVRR